MNVINYLLMTLFNIRINERTEKSLDNITMLVNGSLNLISIISLIISLILSKSELGPFIIEPMFILLDSCILFIILFNTKCKLYFMKETFLTKIFFNINFPENVDNNIINNNDIILTVNILITSTIYFIVRLALILVHIFFLPEMLGMLLMTPAIVLVTSAISISIVGGLIYCIYSHIFGCLRIKNHICCDYSDFDRRTINSEMNGSNFGVAFLSAARIIVLFVIISRYSISEPKAICMMVGSLPLIYAVKIPFPESMVRKASILLFNLDSDHRGPLQYFINIYMVLITPIELVVYSDLIVLLDAPLMLLTLSFILQIIGRCFSGCCASIREDCRICGKETVAVENVEVVVSNT